MRQHLLGLARGVVQGLLQAPEQGKATLACRVRACVMHTARTETSMGTCADARASNMGVLVTVVGGHRYHGIITKSKAAMHVVRALHGLAMPTRLCCTASDSPLVRVMGVELYA